MLPPCSSICQQRILDVCLCTTNFLATSFVSKSVPNGKFPNSGDALVRLWKLCCKTKQSTNRSRTQFVQNWLTQYDGFLKGHYHVKDFSFRGNVPLVTIHIYICSQPHKQIITLDWRTTVAARNPGNAHSRSSPLHNQHFLLPNPRIKQYK